jgi:hypothetical protein
MRVLLPVPCPAQLAAGSCSLSATNAGKNGCWAWQLQAACKLQRKTPANSLGASTISPMSCTNTKPGGFASCASPDTAKNQPTLLLLYLSCNFKLKHHESSGVLRCCTDEAWRLAGASNMP